MPTLAEVASFVHGMRGQLLRLPSSLSFSSQRQGRQPVQYQTLVDGSRNLRLGLAACSTHAAWVLYKLPPLQTPPSP